MSEPVTEPTSTAPSVSTGSLRFNGQPQALTNALSLSELLARHGIAPESVATAVNGQFVQRSQRAATALHPGDEVLTFQAIVGG
ncbi:MAG: sulfur carrier protein [Hydrogenophaga sp.]|jgi:sulfur carrier protein